MIRDSITFPQYDSPDDKTGDALKEERQKNAVFDDLLSPVSATIAEKELTALLDTAKQLELDEPRTQAVNGKEINMTVFDSILPF